jgi:hypothetical protein
VVTLTSLFSVSIYRQPQNPLAADDLDCGDCCSLKDTLGILPSVSNTVAISVDCGVSQSNSRL